MIPHTTAYSLRRRQPELDGRLFASGLAARLFGPGPPTRLAARLRGAALDRELTTGADPASCPRLAARAAYLTCRRTRASLADTVERLVLAAALSGGRVRVRPRAGVLANRGALLQLAGALRGEAPVYAGGVAELRLALRDGAGPFYVDRTGEALARQLEAISTKLRG